MKLQLIVFAIFLLAFTSACTKNTATSDIPPLENEPLEDRDADADVLEPSEIMDSAEVEELSEVELKTEDLQPTDQHVYSAELEDVSGGSGTGTVRTTFDGDTFILNGEFDVPDPSGTDFYEGWVVRQGTNVSVISTGALTKVGDLYENNFESADDLTDHTFYVLTIEPDDGDPAPAGHILEGTLEVIVR